ncbi:intercellular trafficking and secretion [Kappamyces sp. JEL0680]|nr:intercellular trafficking and secretion [Kappamyces sp. JEL0680]
MAWNSHGAGEPSTAGSPSQPNSGFQEYSGSQAQLDPSSLTHFEPLSRPQITVTEPLKHGEGSQAFVSYLVTSEKQALVDSSGRDSTVFDNFTEGFINAFSKVKVPDEKFLAIRSTVENFTTNVENVERLHRRLLKVERDLAITFTELGGAMDSLGAMETQITEPLAAFAKETTQHVQHLRDKIETQDLDYVTPLHQYTNYCGAVRETIRLRDQKQIDHEELIRFQTETTADRDRTRATGKSPGIGGFFKDKINDFKGVDPEKTRQERLSKLEQRIKELDEAVVSSEETSRNFSAQVLQDIEYFNQFKQSDFKDLFRAYTDAQLEFHEKGLGFWESMLPVVDDIRLAEN